MVAGLLNASSTAAAVRPKIYVLPPQSAAIQQPFAQGLYVAGAGGTISRAGAIASLERGKVENALLGGKPRGRILADVVFGLPAAGAPRPLALVELPTPGKQPNTKRYTVVIAGAGYRGILTSSSTRIRGLVAIADIAPTLVDLEHGGSPPIRWHPDDNAVAHLEALDRRLGRVHRDRGWVLTVVALTLFALAVVWPRAAVVVGAAAITLSLWLAATGTTRFWEVLLWMATVPAVLAVLASVRTRTIPVAVAVFLCAFTVVLAWSPETNSLGVLGARPDGGGRFYGVGNQLETLLLPPVIAAIVVGGLPWLVPIGALALVTIAWSKTGADGGGLIVYAVALGMLFLRLGRTPLTLRRAGLAAAAVVALALALVGIDAALGGSSHVTHAVGGGPGSLVGDFGHRLHLSWALATKSAYNIVFFLVSLAVLVWIGTRSPRRPAVDAMLVALAVSLLVNDTPVDVIGLGALGCLALLRFESVDSRPMRRVALSGVCAVVALTVAGCGSQGVVSPTPKTVVGTVAQEAPGKGIFVAQGCGQCHTYQPAGPEANGNIGPDLDKLASYAKTAKQPLPAFVHDSIVDPNKYVQPGFPKNVMPKSYKSLPAKDLKDLVDFLSKPQG